MNIKESVSNWVEVMRPFSWPCIILPALLGGAFAFKKGEFSALRFIILLAGIMLIHIGITIVNEYYDVKNNIDTIEQEKPSKVLVEKRINPEMALKVSHFLILLAFIGSSIFIIYTGLWRLYIFLAMGILGGYYYTAPPIHLKYRGLGVPANFIILGLLIPQAVNYGLQGEIYIPGVGLSLTMGLLTIAILWINDMRDIEADQGITTLVGLLGLKKSFYIYLFLLFSPYLLLIYYIYTGVFAIYGLAGFFTLPLPIWLALKAYKGVQGRREHLSYLDQQTAYLMLSFNIIWLIIYVSS